MMEMSKISLGTAALGNKYGKLGAKCSKKNFSIITTKAQKIGIKHIDTAPSYGNSEQIIGSLQLKEFEISSKISLSHTRIRPFLDLQHSIENSLQCLKKDTLDTLLIHDPWTLSTKELSGFCDFLIDLNSRKRFFKKLGLSVYSPEEFLVLSHLDLDVVQAPLNVFDLRFLDSSFLAVLESRNIEFHARSLFLQGLALQQKNSSKIPEVLRKPIQILDEICEALKLSRASVLAGFALQCPHVRRVLVGINHPTELGDIENTPSQRIYDLLFDAHVGRGLPQEIIDPRFW